MSNAVVVQQEEVRSVSTSNETSQEVLLDRVVESVRRDSQQSPSTYLAETVVPHGGE
jgi:hypothetical protein